MSASEPGSKRFAAAPRTDSLVPYVLLIHFPSPLLCSQDAQNKLISSEPASKEKCDWNELHNSAVKAAGLRGSGRFPLPPLSWRWVFQQESGFPLSSSAGPASCCRLHILFQRVVGFCPEKKKIFHAVFFFYASNPQPWHYWHFGLDNPLWSWGAERVCGLEEGFPASLASTCWLPASLYPLPVLTIKHVCIVRCPHGPKLCLVKNHCLRWNCRKDFKYFITAMLHRTTICSPFKAFTKTS